MNEENSQKSSPNTPAGQKPLQSIHTYESAIAEAMKQKEVSMINIAVAEQEKRQTATIEVKRHAFLIPIIAILIVGSVVSYLIIYLVKQQIDDTSTPLETKSRIISTEVEHVIPVMANEDIIFAMGTAASGAENKAGTLARFTFTDERSTTTRDRAIPLPVNAITSQLITMPSHLARSLTNEFVIGYHMKETAQEPFIIFKTASYQTGFGGMLQWEKSMIGDIQNFLQSVGFSLNEEPVSFSDTIIRNKDVRIAKNAEGKSILLYALTDKETIVITTNQETFIEILGRLSTSQFVQ